MTPEQRVKIRKWQGDDAYSWAVFVDGNARWTGLLRREANYYRALELEKLRTKV